MPKHRLVCIKLTTPLYFPDNVVTACVECGAALQHRLHAPPDTEPICEDCLLDDTREQGGIIHAALTPETQAELEALLKKTDH